MPHPVPPRQALEPLRQRYTTNFGRDISNQPRLSPGCQPFGAQSKSYFQIQQPRPSSNSHLANQGSYANGLAVAPSMPIANMMTASPGQMSISTSRSMGSIDQSGHHQNGNLSNDQAYRSMYHSNGIPRHPPLSTQRSDFQAMPRPVQTMQQGYQGQPSSANSHKPSGHFKSVPRHQEYINPALKAGHFVTPSMPGVYPSQHIHDNSSTRGSSHSNAAQSRNSGYFAGQGLRPAGYQSPYSASSGFTIPYLPHAPPKSRQPQQGIYSTYEQFWKDLRKSSKSEDTPGSELAKEEQVYSAQDAPLTRDSYLAKDEAHTTPAYSQPQDDKLTENPPGMEKAIPVDKNLEHVRTAEKGGPVQTEMYSTNH